MPFRGPHVIAEQLQVPESLKRLQEQFVGLARPMAEFVYERTTDMPLWASKMNGAPYIPLSAGVHPKGWRMLIQINFGEVPRATETWPGLEGFPEQGLVQVWWGKQSGDCSKTGIVFYDEVIQDPEQLQTVFPYKYADTIEPWDDAFVKTANKRAEEKRVSKAIQLLPTPDHGALNHGSSKHNTATQKDGREIYMYITDPKFGYTTDPPDHVSLAESEEDLDANPKTKSDKIYGLYGDEAWPTIVSDPPYQIKYNRGYSLPPPGCRDYHRQNWPDDIDPDTLWEYLRKAATPPSDSCLGGYPTYTQEDSDERPDVQLIQIGCSHNTMFGDAGLGHWFISLDSLKRKDFSNVVFMWDCC
ncbi:hypothetical protein GNI_003310 [Gregarina niphandrodes]|uniref:DUF1963 domain-containing protein n=1 Tax=Gregarina niphandrodes TaxID=110365 RepID=A0A023BDN5_GRENI|nr:hypothetical protein GNI_003310 [Gregarina niphandrodes]EZG89038.1 hypothetical protein GNI_003310 [Gregarina niphandrodes]|eukprot:XP_011128507.1 hypothetical protein GNI_003310 [Gregarina niphandrodes]